MTATDTTIADQGAALGRDPTGQIPAAVSAAFAAERTALTAAGVPEGVASVGSGMPDGALLDTDGRPATLAQVRDGRPAVGPEGQPVGAGDAGKQAERIFENIRAILAAHGATLRHVAKLTTFFADMADRAEVGPVRDRYFPAPAPPNTVVEVSRLAHADWLLEVEAVAVVKA